MTSPVAGVAGDAAGDAGLVLSEQSGAAGAARTEQRPLLAGRYALGPVIGTGGMARVHRAEDTVLGRPVAVKVFRLDADPMQAPRIQTEIRTLAGVQHPGLVGVYDAGTWLRDDGVEVPFLVMELVDGRTLSACCVDGSLGADELALIGAELADALAHVHAQGIVHRDVKPANVLLDAAGRPKLADFGIARLVDSARQTQTGMTLGTAAYLSPEQVKGQPVGPASDVYSLGLVLLEALTGRREYPGASVETALARLERPPVVPPELALHPLLVRMTATEPAERPSAAEVAAALRGAPLPGSDAAGVTVAAPPTAVLPGVAAAAGAAPLIPSSRPTRPAPTERPGLLVEVLQEAVRNRYVVGAVLLLLAVVVAVAVLVATAGKPPEVPAPAPAAPPVSQLEQDLADLREAVTP